MIGHSDRRTNEAADFKTEDYDCAMQYVAALGICGNAFGGKLVKLIGTHLR